MVLWFRRFRFFLGELLAEQKELIRGAPLRGDEAAQPVSKKKVEFQESSGADDTAVTAETTTESGNESSAKPKKGLRFHPSVLLWPAAEEGDVKELYHLLQQCSVLPDGQHPTENGGAVSPYAVRVDYNKTNSEGLTLVHLCCLLGDEALDCVRLLVQLGAEVNLRDNKGFTPLSLAGWQRNERIISYLLEVMPCGDTFQ